MAIRSRVCPALEHEFIAMREDATRARPVLFLYCQRCAQYRWSALEPREELPEAVLDAFAEDSDARGA